MNLYVVFERIYDRRHRSGQLSKTNYATQGRRREKMPRRYDSQPYPRGGPSVSDKKNDSTLVLFVAPTCLQLHLAYLCAILTCGEIPWLLFLSCTSGIANTMCITLGLDKKKGGFQLVWNGAEWNRLGDLSFLSLGGLDFRLARLCGAGVVFLGS